MEIRERLTALADKKAAEFAQREELLACALTGSLARGMVWEGSDLDFWGFWNKEEDEFEDGVEDGIYWEIDIQSLDWLRGWSDDDYLKPPEFNADEYGTGPMEALWGAKVLADREGTLTQVVTQIQRLMADRDWLNTRATNYLRYGLECLENLADESPQRAIMDVRKIAIVYGINAYWMKRGKLLTSAIRIPERLADSPEIQSLFRQIFGLEGKKGWERFYAAYKALPEIIQDEIEPDMLLEILPAVKLGAVEGGVCHFRFIAEDWYEFGDISPVMGFEADLNAQKIRVIEQAKQLMRLIDSETVS